MVSTGSTTTRLPCRNQVRYDQRASSARPKAAENVGTQRFQLPKYNLVRSDANSEESQAGVVDLYLTDGEYGTRLQRLNARLLVQ